MSSQRPANPPPGFDELSREEQIEYVQQLWNRIAAAEQDVEVPDWHRQLLRERLRTESSEEDVAWEELRDWLESRSRD